MIRLPSFFKRKTQSDDLESGSVGRRTTQRTAPRAFQRALESEELALTEDPEQQRARHRLIGATILVLIAVIGLPRILDNKPKAVSNNIAVNIVTSLPTTSEDARPEIKTEDKPKSEVVPETPKVIAPTSDIKNEAKPEAKPDMKPEPKTSAPAPAKGSALGLAAGEEVIVAAGAKPKIEEGSKSNPVDSAVGSGKYVIQIGAFASEDRAKGWIAKLKDQKIPNYVSNKTGADGTKLFLLRAGPYADKDAAEAAEKKIKAMGLAPRLVETGKQ